MDLGMSTACFFSRLLTEEAVVRIGEMGIKNIEVFLCCASEYKLAYVKELKQRIDDWGLNVASVHPLSVQFEPQLFTSHPRALTDAYDVLENVLEAASFLNARLYTFHGVANLKKIKPVLNFARIAENVSRVAEKCREYGVRLAWENVHWCLFSDTDFLSNLLLHTLSDNIVFTLDIKQAAQAKIKPEAFVRLMGRRLANIHLCDYKTDPERGVIACLPFEGCLDFNALKQALQDYKGYLTYEVYAEDYRNDEELASNFSKTAAFFK